MYITEAMGRLPQMSINEAMARLPPVPINEAMGDPPTLLDTQKATCLLSSGEAPGSDSIPASIEYDLYA